MGLSRDDLVYDIARHVDATVHMFEDWGLPLHKTPEGRYVREGRWQIMIHGESYKPIVSEAAKKAVGNGVPLPMGRAIAKAVKASVGAGLTDSLAGGVTP